MVDELAGIVIDYERSPLVETKEVVLVLRRQLQHAANHLPLLHFRATAFTPCKRNQ